MVHCLCLSSVDRKTKVGTGSGKLVHGELHVFRTTGAQCAVISEQEVTELIEVDLGLSLKASQVKQLAVCSVSVADAWVRVRVPKGI